MDRRFEARKRELLEDCQVSLEVFNGMLNRLEKFAEPYLQCLVRTGQKEHAKANYQGLLSDLQRKNAEAIAYRHDQERIGLQMFLDASPWDHTPCSTSSSIKLARQLGRPIP